MIKRASWLGLGALLWGGACTPAPTAPDHPTWVDVAPILRGECTGCHGPTAATTGLNYRLDFYTMSAAICGEAARAMPDGTFTLAGQAAPFIAMDVTPTNYDRPRMPPLPGSPLPDWQRDTLTRWGAQGPMPAEGSMPPGNHPPVIEVGQLPFQIDTQLTFTAIVSDPDGDAAIGTIEIGDKAFLMDRAGSWAVAFDSSQWAPGTARITAYLCDGWTNISYDLGPIQIAH
jgi:hypothetical protein